LYAFQTLRRFLAARLVSAAGRAVIAALVLLAKLHAAFLAPVFDSARSPTARTRAALRAMFLSTAFILLLLVAYTLVLIPFTPAISDLKKAKADTPSVLVSADGKQLAVFRQLNREWVELDRISPHVIDALIATEDHRFHQHFGVDIKRTAASIVHTLRGSPQGGSTITQQLARNLYPEQIGRERTLTRKLKELITALKIEYAYSKEEILLTYLNTMPFLYNAFGIEMGARTYFDKSAAELNVLESATLVGMLKGTSYYNPVQRPERALARRNVVLAQMAKRGVLEPREVTRLQQRPLRLDFTRQSEPVGNAPHLAAHTRKWLIEWADRNDYNLHADGLTIVSTVDARLQTQAERAVARRMQALQALADADWALGAGSKQRQVQPGGAMWRERGELLNVFVRESAAYREALERGTPPDAALAALRQDRAFLSRLLAEKTRLETGFVAIDPRTSHVKAWVGSRDFARDQFDHVAAARRQPGSTFKAFVYGAALEQGMRADTRMVDSAVEIEVGAGEIWRPTDVSAPSGRELTLREALAQSKNTVTARVMQEVGPHKVATFARRLGVNQSPLQAVPALALGTSPVTLLEMVSAYATIAAGGEYRAPLLVMRILDKEGKVVAEFSSKAERAISAQTAHELTGMLRVAVDQGTGRSVRRHTGARAQLAGKTGTTQNNTDGWFILMHPELAAGAWVGFNDARITMGGDHWGQGARNALPLVGDVTGRALRARLIDANASFPQPPESWFDGMRRKVGGWFDWSTSQPAPKTVPRAAPAPLQVQAEPEPSSVLRVDEMTRITQQAQEQAGLPDTEDDFPVIDAAITAAEDEAERPVPDPGLPLVPRLVPPPATVVPAAAVSTPPGR